jgi:hypothetical protein
MVRDGTGVLGDKDVLGCHAAAKCLERLLNTLSDFWRQLVQWIILHKGCFPFLAEVVFLLAQQSIGMVPV